MAAESQVSPAPADDRHLPETLRFIAYAVEVARAAG